ncbi:hypothetical protein [Butyrivibrio proteoclasticus]|uniref:hypothetical protein n=1 Tax=Butyrivibrio proteoclasticus TaxID=43305 RepID=UPI00047D1AC4|nr:hypothetical protein [Butyrivibrio proteoclasticus]
MYKKGDKVIILDYNNKPLIPQVVAEIEDVCGPDRVRLHLPDNACCLEFTDRFEKIDEKTYDEYLHAVRTREKELPVDLQLDIRKFATKHPRRRKDEILHMFNQDKRYVSTINAYMGRVRMYGKENINERFLYEYKEALYGIIKTRTFFHELDNDIPIPDVDL